MDYHKLYNKYKKKYLNLKNSLNGGTSASSISEIFYGEEYQLIKDQKLDHCFFEKNIEFEDQKFKLFSLNIAQKDYIRTMVIFNKLVSYIRTENKLNKLDSINSEFLEELSNITKNYHNELIKYEKGKKQQDLQISKIRDDIKKLITKHFKKEENVFTFDENGEPIFKIDLSWAKTKDKYYSEISMDELLKKKNNATGQYEIENIENMILFKQRYPFDYYLDIFSDEESDDKYYSRIDQIIEFLMKRTESEKDESFKQNIIICLQEINPAIAIDPATKKGNNFRTELINIFKTKHKLNLIQPSQQYFEHLNGTCSLVITTESISNLIKINDDDLKITQEQKDGKEIINKESENKLIKNLDPERKKGIFQNFRYTIEKNGKKLELFNVHLPLYANDTAYRKLNQIINYTNEGEKNLILIGDMNLKLDPIHIHRITKLFRDKRFALELLQTPEIDFNNLKNDGSTYDIFIAKGVKIYY